MLFYIYYFTLKRTICKAFKSFIPVISEIFGAHITGPFFDLLDGEVLLDHLHQAVNMPSHVGIAASQINLAAGRD